MKDMRVYCSPSRLILFLENKRAFLQKYFFKLEKPSTKTQEKGKLTHDLIYSILRGEHFIVQPEFGPLRKTDQVSSEEAKNNKIRRNVWILENSGKKIITKNEEEMIIAMQAVIEHNPKFKKVLIEAVENGGVEREIHIDEPKIKGVVDLIGCWTGVEIKTTSKGDWLDKDKSHNFFKWNEENFCIQNVFYEEILSKFFQEKFKFYWFVVCNEYPFGANFVSFEESFFEDVKKLVFKKYLPEYEKFCDEVRQIFGYDFFLKDMYNGDKVGDLLKLQPLLSGEPGAEVVTPQYWAYRDLELKLGYVGEG